jgi:hypothetical protein
MIIMDIQKLTDLRIEMEKISVRIKEELRRRWPSVVVTQADIDDDPEMGDVGDEYPGDRESELLSAIGSRAIQFEDLTVVETFELVEWIERHRWLLEGGT